MHFMKTKIVYDVICSANDFYFEQLFASLWSLKHYNPTAYVILLTDEASSIAIKAKGYEETDELIDEIKIVDFDEKLTNKEKSRWIKTNLRKLLTDDFLFVDADTIISGSLDALDSFEGDICGVLDNHCHSAVISGYDIFKRMYVEPLQRIFNIRYQASTDMFNSGVLLVRDTPAAHLLFERWHDNWEKSRMQGECRDQLALLATCQELKNPIIELPGEYNCQIRFSIQYLCKCKILHTFASQGESSLSPVLGVNFYKQILSAGGISEAVGKQLLDWQSSFSSPSYLHDKDWMKLSFEPACLFVNSNMNSTKKANIFFLNVLNFLARLFTFILRHI